MTKNATKRRATATRTGGADGRRATKAAPATMPPPSGERRRALRAANAAVLGTDFEPLPEYARLEDYGAGTWLAHSIAPSAADEPIAGGLDQIADDLIVFALALQGGGESEISATLIVSTLHAIETRTRVLAAIARRTLAALEGRAA